MREDTRTRSELETACEIQQDQLNGMENYAEEAYDVLDELIETGNEAAIAKIRTALENINHSLG